MKKIVKFFDGKKTFIVAVIVAVATFAKIIEWISVAQYEAILGFLVAIGVYTVRSAIRKIEK